MAVSSWRMGAIRYSGYGIGSSGSKSKIDYDMVTRRDVLRTSLGFAAAAIAGPRVFAQGLGEFTTPSVPCGDVKPTPAAADAATFKDGAPLKASLVEAGVTGERLVLTGTVSGVVCGAIKGARVDFWQAD